MKDIRNLFRLERETKAIKDRILRDIKNPFEHEAEENSYRNKTLSVEEYLNKIRPYLKDIINNFKKSCTCKIQLTIANNFISSRDHDEERVMHLKSGNIEIMVNSETDEVIKQLFDSLKDR